MAYRIKFSETPEQALARIGVEQIQRAERALDPAAEPGKAVHETRKCIKRIRALLRLVRPGLAAGVFDEENLRYRNIGQLLSPARDAQILFETAAKLEPASAAGLEIAELKAHWEAARSRERTGYDPAPMARARAQLAAAKAAMENLTVSGSGLQSIEKGLRISYRAARQRFARAYEEQSSEAFHDWRKSVQLHWRHMALLARAWPDMFSARIEAARQLSQILGDAQDLSILIAHIEALPPRDLSQSTSEHLVQAALTKQQVLRASAQPRGEMLFSLTPKALSSSMIEVWEAARRLDALPAVAPSRAPAPDVKPSKPEDGVAAGT